MERNFSVDDLLGSMLKTLSSGSFHGFDPESWEPSGFVEESGKKMPRIDSVCVFQEFLRHHASPDDSATGSEGITKPEMDKAMRRIDSVRAFQEFLKNHALNDSGASEEGDAEQSKRASLNHQTLCLPQADVREDADDLPRCNDLVPNSRGSQSSHQCFDISVRSSKYHLPTLEKQCEDECNGSKSPTTERSSAAELIDLREGQVSGALSPLFTGLQVDTNSFSQRDPQEYEHFLKRQLDMACAAVALARVSSSFSLLDSANLQVNSFQIKKISSKFLL
ncbi:hypothetical protein L7F22_058039 [Adiantum nelumboides]|nr:hypothetical protein [Adiantum nelumboides]